MFAVKGWNVDASSLKLQTKPFEVQNESSNAKSTSRKRKRDAQKSEANQQAPVAADHVVDSEHKSNKKSKKKKTSKTNVATDGSADIKHDRTHSSPEPGSKPTKKQEKKKRNDRESGKQRDIKEGDRDHLANGSDVKTVQQPQTQIASTAKLTPMQAAMRQKLISARFRHLNETLYTAPSQRSQALFDANPDMFEEYHAGFRQQVAVWPENPVDKMLQKLRERGEVRLPNQKKAFKGKPSTSEQSAGQASTMSNALPRTQGTCTVADCGCGDARLAHALKTSNDLQRLKLKVLSYDLQSPSPHVIKADIANLPLADGSIDVVIFCLALMGTNWLSFIEEAYRVLRWKGELWIAEIKSRFGRVEHKKGRVVEHSVGNRKKRAAITKASVQQQKLKDEANQEQVLAVEVDGAENVKSESDVQEFLNALERRGFVVKDSANSIDMDNKMFVSMELIKAASPSKGRVVDEKKSGPHMRKAAVEKEISSEDEAKTLKPCLYKLR